LEVTLEAEKLPSPARLGNLKLVVTAPAPLTAAQLTTLERSVHHCLIHQTLLAPPRIDIAVAAS
jgi:hypothetical protein